MTTPSTVSVPRPFVAYLNKHNDKNDTSLTTRVQKTRPTRDHGAGK